nr:hypothetical protein [Tanacetum cinerariifolium]
MSEDSSAAGTDNRPPMLKESDYESWKIHIKRYIKGKTHGKLIWKSILNGPSAHPQITDPVPTGQTLDRRKEDLFDKYERFRANGNELLQDYFVRFHKLINDMMVTKLTIPTHQMNTKFVNNLPRTGKLKKKEQSSSVVGPLAYLVKTTHQQAPTHSTTTSPSQLTPALSSTLSSTAQSHDDAMSSSNTGTHATVHDGQITTESVQRRASGNTGNTGYRGNQNHGQGVNNKKKVICYNCRRERHVSRQCKEPKR